MTFWVGLCRFVFKRSCLLVSNQKSFPLKLEVHTTLPSNQDCGPKSTHDSRMTAKITLFTLCKQPPYPAMSSLLDLLCSLQVGFRLLHFRLGIFLCALGILLHFFCSTILISIFLQKATTHAGFCCLSSLDIFGKKKL